MSPDRLRHCSRKQLESLARRKGVANVRTLRKSDLIDVLTGAAPKSANGSRSPKAAPRRTARKPAGPARHRALAHDPAVKHDALTVTAVESHWLRVAWQVARASVDRAAAALGTDWHSATAVLRFSDVTTTDDRPRREVIDVDIPAGPPVWFQPVPDPTRTYAVWLGYRSANGRYHWLVRSQPITPARTRPQVATNGSAANGDAAHDWPGVWHPRVVGDPQSSGDEVCVPPLHLEVELLLRGATHPGALVTIEGKPVPLLPDGRFVARIPLPTGRQVIPAVATAGDHTSERTVVLAIDSSTRELEPRVFDETW
jgi:uncharacterized protein